MNLNNLYINSKLTVSGAANINNLIDINGFLSSDYKWFSISNNFTFIGGTTYQSGFFFTNYPFLLDCGYSRI